MATRSITTSRPAVACDVCGRNLLRGELSDVFIAAGQRRTVCELCVTRATHEGWLREADGAPATPRAPRGRRARTLMGRLRQLRDAPPSEVPEPHEPDFDQLGPELGELDQEEPDPGPDSSSPGQEPVRASHPRRATPRAAAPQATHPPSPDWMPRSVHAVPTNAELKAARALEVFNVGDEPRRVAGVARSLGAPSVVARSIPGSGTMVSIVVAWELCWYHYEVDLAEEGAGARLIAQGMELDELDELDRAPNAVADERGELQMLA
jgi:hypothetical protein